MSLGDPPNWAALGITHNPLAQVGKSHVENHMRAKEAQALYDQMRNANMLSIANGDWVNSPTATASQPTLAERAREMFLKRMGGIRQGKKVAPVDFVSCHIYNEQVFLFYCFNGKAGVVDEGIDMFPSDQLITQFRMILA